MLNQNCKVEIVRIELREDLLKISNLGFAYFNSMKQGC